MSEEETEGKVVLEERVIKKYLMLKYMRPTTNKRNIGLRRSQSKDKQMRLGDFLNPTKSNSPLKRRELYETPKVEKPKLTLKFTLEKK